MDERLYASFLAQQPLLDWRDPRSLTQTMIAMFRHLAGTRRPAACLPRRARRSKRGWQALSRRSPISTPIT
ncbi:MAG: hypothetical protein U0703_25030 [Anaerolineae bacterium]